MSDINIVEVGPRDGLQNEKVFLSLEEKREFVKKLSQTGLNRIELGSFVSPRWVPQMQNTEDLVQRILRDQDFGEIPKSVRFSVLVPNLKGLNRAVKSGIKEIAIFLSATESFSKKNINCSILESYTNYQHICRQAIKENLKIRAYLSVCFYCPYEGPVSHEAVLEWAKKLEDLKVDEIAISDTTGQARAFEVEVLLEKLFDSISKDKLACHFHDVHGMALTNVWSAYKMGIRVFDGSIGGLGGCPYTQSPVGNTPTEGLLYLFKGPGDPVIGKLTRTALWLQEKIGKSLPSAFLRSPLASY